MKFINRIVPGFFAAFIFLSPAVGHTDIYRYVDQEGVVHFSKIKHNDKYLLYMKESSSASHTVKKNNRSRSQARNDVASTEKYVEAPEYHPDYRPDQKTEYRSGCSGDGGAIFLAIVVIGLFAVGIINYPKRQARRKNMTETERLLEDILDNMPFD